MLLRRFNQFTGLVFVAYAAFVLVGRERAWELFFAETHEVTALSTFLTFGVGIALGAYGLFLIATSFFPHDPRSENLILCAHWITWIAWCIFDWFYFYAYSPVFKYLNMACSNGTLFVLFCITVILYRQRHAEAH